MNINALSSVIDISTYTYIQWDLIPLEVLSTQKELLCALIGEEDRSNFTVNRYFEFM
jgi:hypothetical protein